MQLPSGSIISADAVADLGKDIAFGFNLTDSLLIYPEIPGWHALTISHMEMDNGRTGVITFMGITGLFLRLFR